MKIGSKLKQGKLYWTKSGMGEVIPFNLGPLGDILPVSDTYTEDVWWCQISRHITAIAETEEAAKDIKY